MKHEAHIRERTRPRVQAIRFGTLKAAANIPPERCYPIITPEEQALQARAPAFPAKSVLDAQARA